MAKMVKKMPYTGEQMLALIGHIRKKNITAITSENYGEICEKMGIVVIDLKNSKNGKKHHLEKLRNIFRQSLRRLDKIYEEYYLTGRLIADELFDHFCNPSALDITIGQYLFDYYCKII